MKKQILILILLPFIIISCKDKQPKPRTQEIYDNFYNKDGELDSIKRVIVNLPMVKNLSYHPTLMSPRMTIDENDSVWYQVGENTKERFRPEFNFYYYRKNQTTEINGYRY
jgi:hypothetical protein